MSYKKSWTFFALLVVLVLLSSCSKKTATISDLCPKPANMAEGAAQVIGILCEHEWKEGDPEKEFCDWVGRILLQQEELGLYHEYNSKMPN